MLNCLERDNVYSKKIESMKTEQILCKINRFESIGNFIAQEYGWNVNVRLFDISDLERTMYYHDWNEEKAFILWEKYDDASVSSLDGVNMDITIGPRTTTRVFMHEISHMIFDTDDERTADRYAEMLMKTKYRSWLYQSRKFKL